MSLIGRALVSGRDGIRELWVRPAHQVPALDALRAFAILMVVGGHFFGFFWWDYGISVPKPALASFPFFNWGWTGVDLFFILSGYLIGGQIWRERQKSGTVRVGRFLLRRGLRIWPLFYFMLLFYVVVPSKVHPNVWDFTFLSNYMRGGFEIAWSLATEEQFYIFVPLLLLCTPFVKRLDRYFWVLGGCFVFVWVMRYLTWQHLAATGLSGKKLLDTMHFPIHLHCEGLLFGLTISLLATVRPKLFDRPAGAGVSYRGLAVFAAVATVGIGLRAYNKTLFAFTGLACAYGGMTLWLLWDRSLLSSWARWRVWYPISRLSYGMYLNHFLVLPGITFWAFNRMLGVASVEAASLVGMTVGTVVSMGVATATFLLVERPFLMLRDRWLHGRVHQPAGHHPGRVHLPSDGGYAPAPERVSTEAAR